ncbi:hypothetical protein [Corynebacterium sp. CNJ-954]|nr:hypothetical protein [Corynebacterium sp. CNJ-954]
MSSIPERQRFYVTEYDAMQSLATNVNAADPKHDRAAVIYHDRF